MLTINLKILNALCRPDKTHLGARCGLQGLPAVTFGPGKRGSRKGRETTGSRDERRNAWAKEHLWVGGVWLRVGQITGEVGRSP